MSAAEIPDESVFPGSWVSLDEVDLRRLEILWLVLGRVGDSSEESDTGWVLESDSEESWVLE